MKTVGAQQAKTQLSALLDEVERGETVTVTRHGVPIAHIQPTREARIRRNREVIQEFRRIRERYGPPRVSAEEFAAWIREGREERDLRIIPAPGETAAP